MTLKKEENLWNAEEIYDLFSKKIDRDWECNSIAIDSRKVKPGNIFLAMPGTKFDGHDFVLEAIDAGARSIIVKNSLKILNTKIEVILVEDVYKSLLLLAKASRKRINNAKNIIAITGSSGKTSTKEMIGKAFKSIGKTFINPGSYNNQVGVPFSLANMPRNTDFGIFELGMNNFNEISTLSKLVQPNIAIITNISEAHIGNFNSIKDIIKAKAEIFNGLKKDGYILINNDHYYDEIIKYTKNYSQSNVLTYGANKKADIRLVNRNKSNNGQKITAEADGKTYKYEVSLDGQHQAVNSLAVIGSLMLANCDINKGLSNLDKITLPTGRGAKYHLLVKGEESILIDDTYNANLSSMIASLHSLNEIAKSNRKVLIFGEMGELGVFSESLHNKLYDYLISFNIGLVVFIGNQTKQLYTLCMNTIECIWIENITKSGEDIIFNLIKPRDCILVKGSRHMKMEIIVKKLLHNFKGK